MAHRGPLRQLDRYFAAATIAHEYVADLHRELAELHADNAHTRELLGESAAVIVRRMPELTRELRDLERELREQELLSPRRAVRTVEVLAARFADLDPALAALRARQDEIAAELVNLIDRARRG
jgi:hypothetical protein